MNTESWNAVLQPHQKNSLRAILASLDGFLSRYTNGSSGGFTCSPVNITVNIVINAPQGGGARAEVNMR